MTITAASPGSASTGDKYLLSAEEIAHFDELGYVVLKNRIPADLIMRLREAARSWIDDGNTHINDDESGDYNFATRPTGRQLFRINYLHSKGHAASLELLGSPQVLGIAESLAGANFVPTYESLVFKGEDDGAPIDWHQDAVHPRTHRIFNVDVYLDQSRKGEGALRVAPGSQKAPVDVCQLQEEFGWDAPGVVQTELDAGDVLVHDVMLVHGSEATTHNRLRRTIYYEFRAAEQIAAEGPWDAAWVDRRLRLIPVAIKTWAAANPGGSPFAWGIENGLRPDLSDDDEVELRIAHSVHSPGSYCSAGNVETKPRGREV